MISNTTSIIDLRSLDTITESRTSAVDINYQLLDDSYFDSNVNHLDLNNQGEFLFMNRFDEVSESRQLEAYENCCRDNEPFQGERSEQRSIGSRTIEEHVRDEYMQGGHIEHSSHLVNEDAEFVHPHREMFFNEFGAPFQLENFEGTYEFMDLMDAPRLSYDSIDIDQTIAGHLTGGGIAEMVPGYEYSRYDLIDNIKSYRSFHYTVHHGESTSRLVTFWLESGLEAFRVRLDRQSIKQIRRDDPRSLDSDESAYLFARNSFKDIIFFTQTIRKALLARRDVFMELDEKVAYVEAIIEGIRHGESMVLMHPELLRMELKEIISGTETLRDALCAYLTKWANVHRL